MVTQHEAERMRTKLEELRELAEGRLAKGPAVRPSEILDIIGEPYVPPASTKARQGD